MRSHLKTVALIALSPLVLAAPLAYAQTATQAGSAVTSGKSAAELNELKLGPGDRVQVAAYQREDLSGIFRVGADGTISVPSVGRVMAAGRTTDQLEKDLGGLIVQVTGRLVSLSVEVETWRPVYAVGDVDKPGVYPFTPGLTVLQTLAAAGGVFRPLREVGALELSRQAANVVQFSERLKMALAERARIEAERNGEKVVKASRKLLELASADEVERLIAAETAILRDNLRTLSVATKTNEQEISHIQSEIKAYREQRKELKNRIELVSEELKRYDRLAEKGLARSDRALQLRTEVANLEGTSHAVLASIARSERSLIEVNRTKENLGLERRLELEQQLRTVEGQIREFEQSLDLYEGLILRMGQSELSSTSSTSKMIKRFEIVRGDEIIAAHETSRLQPGDVVRVTTEKRAGADTASLAPNLPIR